MSDRWCNDCSWPYECAQRYACRRAEMGERRVAAPAEVADAIAVEIAERPVCFVGGVGPLRVLPSCVDGEACLNAGACDAQMECERDRRRSRALQCAPPSFNGYTVLTLEQVATLFSGVAEG